MQGNFFKNEVDLKDKQFNYSDSNGDGTLCENANECNQGMLFLQIFTTTKLYNKTLLDLSILET